MHYRSEIDGLRAVAVLSVMLYHFGVTELQGGFLGVDVFFVISGYLITSQIVSQISEGAFSFSGFYARRARRILPALFVVVTFSLLAGVVLLLPTELQALGEQAMFAVFGVSNFYFLAETGYFGREAHQIPLLHTWSLGVEEQFYAIWPLVCVAILTWLKLGRRVAVFVLGLLCLASLGFFFAYREINPEFTFFMLPTRAWQLGLGALIAFAPILRGKVWTDALVVLGLALIFSAAWLTDANSTFMEFGAVAATLGAGLVVWPKANQGPSHWLLSTAPMRGIGKISYSAYLWHWPLLVFFIVWNSGTMPTGTEILLLTVATLAVSYLSYRFVETPVRQRQDRPGRALAVAFAATVILFGLSYAIVHNNGLPTRLSPEKQLVAEYMERKTVRPDHYACDIPDFASAEIDLDCLSEDRFGTPVLLMGDSHANHFGAALRNRYPEAYFHLATYTHCLPVIGSTPNFKNRKNSEQCAENYKWMFEGFLQEPRYGTILLSARWKNNEWERIEETVRFLKKRADRVIVFGPTVEYSAPLPSLLLQDALPRRSIRPLSASYASLEKQQKIDADMKALVTDAGGTYFSILDVLCQDAGADCTAVEETGIPIAWDYGHFSYAGADYVLRAFETRGLQLP